MLGGCVTKRSKKDLLILLTMWASPATILLLALSLYLIQPKVEAKLVSHVQSVLAEHNIEAEVSFSGRDGKLEGEVATQEIANNAYRLSLEVFGTRIIRNHLVIKDEQNKMDREIEMSEMDNESQHPIVQKASYATQPLQTVQKAVYRETLPTIEKQEPEKISDVNKIMMAMSQQTLPTTDDQRLNKKIFSSLSVDINKASIERPQIKTINTPINKIATTPPDAIAIKNSNKNEGTLKSGKANDLLNIIDDFNLSLDSLSDEKIISTQQASKPPSIDHIDLSSIHFADNSTTLPLEAQQVLDKVAATIKAHSLSYIELIAYANDSDIAYARGATIREYLVTKNIKKDSVHVAGHTMENNMKNVTAFKFVTY
jgi:outer membrane protein OmpA-like peptidoglycan-associated protein